MLSSNSFFEKSSISRCLTERCLTFGIYCTPSTSPGTTQVALPVVVIDFLDFFIIFYESLRFFNFTIDLLILTVVLVSILVFYNRSRS